MAREQQVHLRLSDHEAARLDELRGATPRPAFLRELIRTAAPLDDPDEPTHAEAIALLRESAVAGSIGARMALERALRGGDHRQEPPADELEQILGERGS